MFCIEQMHQCTVLDSLVTMSGFQIIEGSGDKTISCGFFFWCLYIDLVLTGVVQQYLSCIHLRRQQWGVLPQVSKYLGPPAVCRPQSTEAKASPKRLPRQWWDNPSMQHQWLYTRHAFKALPSPAKNDGRCSSSLKELQFPIILNKIQFPGLFGGGSAVL